jgi:hypothetical protein
MTRDEALADADREIRRLEDIGRGLFYIAELYGVPVRRHSSRWFDSTDAAHLALPEYLQGSHGTLTLGYLRNALADIAQRIAADAEKEEAGEPADSKPVGDRVLRGLWQGTQDRRRHMGKLGGRDAALSSEGVHEPCHQQHKQIA